MAKELIDFTLAIIVITLISPTECCLMVNNTVQSPGYPSNYPGNSDCIVSIPIPLGMAIEIHFYDFYLEDSSFCRYDYLRIENDKGQKFGVYCGRRSGKSVVVTGYNAMITFHADSIIQKRGFLLNISEVPAEAPPEVYIEKNVMLATPGDPLSCSAYGVPPIYTAILRNSTVLINATDTAASITLAEDGNYTCVATNRYGADEKEISVIFFECASVSNNTLTSPGYPNNYPKNFDCHYSIPIPDFKAIKIEFHYFDLEGYNGYRCIRDYLEVKNDNRRTFGVFCGTKTGEVIFVTGDSVEIIFHTNSIVQKTGFLIAFSEVELASYPACLSQNKKKFKNADEPWLSNATTKCFCKSDLTIECKILDEPACMDINGKIRNNKEEWFNSSCVKCSCRNATISCTQYIVNITYGLLKVDEFGTCEQCSDVSATQEGGSACEAFFQIPKQKLFQCSISGSFIWDIHRCNGVSECPDGSDEMGCQDVLCSDKSGNHFIVKDDNGWQASPCVKCNCKNGNISCERENTVFFPHSSFSVYRFTEICAQPSCNVLHFLSTKGQTCKAIEVMKNKGILMKGQTYRNSGCDFYFEGPRKLYNPSGGVCPTMARMACYVFNGGVCCTSECSALRQVGAALRGNVTYCPSGRQLADIASKCGKSIIGCSRDHGNQNCTSVATCQDEDAHKYFEGATWFVGTCIQCNCTEGKISCKRKINVIAPKRETITEFCNQTVCNVAKYLKTKEGVCKGCRWKGKLFDAGDHWKENGVDFHCSDSRQKVRAGCYVEDGRVSCTGAIPGIRDLSSISNDSLFLCESGDEIRSLNDRCNGYKDCKDQSDERNCVHYFCGAVTESGVYRERTQADHIDIKNCSLIDPTWQGTFTRKCRGGRQPSWSLIIECSCERRRIVNYFKLKLAEVNETNFLDISRELSSSASNFTNKGIFHAMFTDLFDTAVERLKSNSSNSSGLKILYGEHVIKTISEDSIYRNLGFCGDDCVPPLAFQRNALGQRALELIHEVNKSAVWSIPGRDQSCEQKENFVTRGRSFILSSIEIFATELVDHLNTAPLIPNGEDSSHVMPYDVNITVVNKTRIEPSNISDEEVLKILEEHGCKRVTVEKGGKLIVKPSDVTDEALKHENIQWKLENILLCISVGAVTLYFFVLLVLRIKKSEKTFVHVNLLLTLGLGNLVYVVDRTAFSKRMELPALCSVVAVIGHFLHTALFTWMLVEGINLYIKMVKVFSTKKQYLVYTAIGWGIPAVIVGAVAAIRPSTYDMATPLMGEVTCGSLNFTSEIKRTRCWINGSLWIYKGPVLFFLLVNIGLFAILLRVVFGKLAVKYSQENIKRARKGMRTIVALLPLLGVTYLLGFFIRFHTAVAYLFILLNSTQGVFFTIFHCFLDKQVCEELRKITASRKTKPKTSKSATGNKHELPKIPKVELQA